MLHRWMYFAVAVAVAGLLFAPTAAAQARVNPATGTTNLVLGVGAEGALIINTADTIFTEPGAAAFTDYVGTTNYNVKIRTTAAGGTGAVTVQVTSDFAGNGPKVASGVLTYACGAISNITGTTTPCAAGTTALTTGSTAVMGFGANTRSTRPGGDGAVNWTLVNDPMYETGNYTAVATFTLSVS